MTPPRETVQSLYRTYRPQTFEEVRGQAHVARTLSNAVRNGTVAHGYVFAGPRGTGKTSMARILAKALDCVGADSGKPLTGPTPTPCGVCDPCRQIAAGTSLDVIEMDAASNRSIDDVRELRDTVAFAPVRDRFKVYIIDEAHMLTREAFNALLKTLEEPPANVVFVLATTEPHKLPDTIVSRCQRFDFRRPSAQQIAGLLRSIADKEGIAVEDEALDTIAEHSQGGFRDAIGALDRLRSFTDGRIDTDDVLEVLGVTDTQLLVEITDIVADRQTAEALAFVHRLFERGTNYSQFIADLLRHLRRLFLLQNLLDSAEDPALLRALGQNVGLHERSIRQLEPQAHQLSPGALVHFMDLLGQAQSEIKGGLDGRLQLELVLVKLTRPQTDLSPQALDERLRRLELAAEQPRSPEHFGARRPHGPAAGRAQAGVAQPGEAAAAPASAVEAGASETEPPSGGEGGDQTAELTLEHVARVWPRFLELMREHGTTVATLLRDAHPLAAGPGRLAVGLPSAFIRERLREQGDDGPAPTELRALLGTPLEVTFEVQEPQSTLEMQPAADVLTDAQRIALIQKELEAELLPDDP